MYCLQPRRRDFSRSSQGLSDLASALHGLHSPLPTQQHSQQRSQPSATDWQNTMLPRDPFSALPHPHQRPATAATTPPSGFAYTFGQRHQQAGHAQTYRQNLGPASQLGLQDQPYCYSDLRRQSEAGLHQHPAWHRDDFSIKPTASHPQHEHWEGFMPQHSSQQDGHATRHDWSRPVTAEHMLERRGQQPSRLQLMPQTSTRQAWGRSGGVHSQRPARQFLPAAESLGLRTHSAEPANQHDCFMPQTICGQYSSATHGCTDSCMDSSAQSPTFGQQQQQLASHGDQRGAPGVRQPAPGLAQPLCSAHDKSGPLEQSQQIRAQAAAGDDIAAMEAVLSEYKALRNQIAEAEAQLEVLQRRPTQPDIFTWPESNNDKNRGESFYPQGHGYLPDNRHRADTVWAHTAHLTDVTKTLIALKGAAAKQRPAVAAVAQQLQNTLSRLHGTAAK